MRRGLAACLCPALLLVVPVPEAHREDSVGEKLNLKKCLKWEYQLSCFDYRARRSHT